MRLQLFLIISIITALGMNSCTTNEAAESPEKPFMLSDTMMRRVTFETVAQETVKDELKLTGKVAADEDKVIEVFPLVGGTVEQVNVELGDFVQKGQTLAVIRSGEVADFEQQLITAKNDLLIAQKNLSVTQDMFQSKLASEKDYITAKLEVQKAEGEVNRLNQIFKIYNVGRDGSYIVKAPISGFVTDKKLNHDMQIRPDETNSIFTISNLDEVWVLANVYETDISKVQPGYDAYVTTISYPDKIYKGKIDKVYNVLDPDTKVMKVRIRLPNADYLLKPDMFTTVSIRYNEREQLPSIPGSAVIFDKGKNFVMVYHSNDNVETREIEIYKNVGDRTYIQSGLKPGEKIIDKYHLLVYDALND